MAKPTSYPEWCSDEVGIVEPGEAKKDLGWISGEKPPFQYFNWLLNLIYKWVKFFAEEKIVARYGKDTPQVVATGSTDIIDFDTKILDDPDADRVTVGASWKFTADRAMKLRVSVTITIDVDANWTEGEVAEILLYKTEPGPTVTHVLLNGFMFPATPAGNVGLYLQGSAIIDLASGDFFDVRFLQNSGANQTIRGNDYREYVDVEEL